MELQRHFLINELNILAWNASVQRADVYAKCSKRCEDQVRDFRQSVTEFVDGLVAQYTDSVPEKLHCENILALCEHASRAGSKLLTGGRYNCGVAQKLLNLTLKYRWCLGLIAEPPHCPVDRIVINQTRYKEKRNWTQLRDIDAYQEVIEAIREVASKTGLSLAHWELQYYDRERAMKRDHS